MEKDWEMEVKERSENLILSFKEEGKISVKELRDSLNLYFEKPVFWNLNGWDSAFFWNDYLVILKTCDKKVNDFVSQYKLECFFEQLIKGYATREIDIFLQDNSIEISSSMYEEIASMLIAREEIINLIMESLKGVKAPWNEDKFYTLETPYGNIRFNLDYNSVMLYEGGNWQKIGEISH